MVTGSGKENGGTWLAGLVFGHLLLGPELHPAAAGLPGYWVFYLPE
jgi:hypothetical protein